jgi:hypothetical protein
MKPSIHEILSEANTKTKSPIILTDFEKIGITMGRITQVRMLIHPNEHPNTGFGHKTLRLDSKFKVNNDLTIKITAIRLERIKSITPEDALACGYPKRVLRVNNDTNQLSLDPNTVTYFDEAWDDKYGAGAYQVNDWVWVFDVVRWGVV